MAGSALPCTVVICCSLPAGIDADETVALLDAARRAEVPVTWLTAHDALPFVSDELGRKGLPGGVALDIPARCPRTAARELLARARRVVPTLDAAAVRGPLEAACRQELAGSGVRIICRDGLDGPARGSRRPAPAGWRCHSPVWGMWEVVRSEEPFPPGRVGRILGLGAAATLRAGGLTVVDVGHGIPAGSAAAAIRARLGRWKSWAAGGWTASPASFACLSHVPDLIAGAGRAPMGGSILRAA